MKNTVLILLAALALVASGCRTHKGAYEPVDTMRYDLENHLPVVLMDKKVQESVTMAGSDKQVTPEGRLKVTANLRNRLNRRIEVQVSCVFKAADGFSTGDETPWQTLILTEKAQETVTFVSMNNQAKKYTVRVRQVR